MEELVLSQTESICPVCFAAVPARRVARGENVYLQKTCPEHGLFEVVIWRGAPDFNGWVSPKIPSFPAFPSTRVDRGCPLDCGLCPDHRQHTCTALLEVTQRCNLRCSVCFAGAGHESPPDPTLLSIEERLKKLLAASGPCNLQFSGGEPTVRDDLPEIVAMARSLGFPFIQLNTNGLRLAEDPAFVRALAQAGLASVFLQFDGLEESVYRKLRGRDLLREKCSAIQECGQHGIGVVLVPTLVPGVNTDQLGAIIEFGLHRLPTVRGVHFQPVSYFGRYPCPPGDGDRITIPEIIRAIREQTGGKILAEHFKPPGCENALCSFHGNFVFLEDGELRSWTRHQGDGCGCKPVVAAEGAATARRFVAQFWAPPMQPPASSSCCGSQSLGAGWDGFLERARTHSFCISGMAFQDAWNLDLERLRDCCIHVVDGAGRLIPFCAYNVTDAQGRSIYRRQDSVVSCQAVLPPGDTA